MTAATAMSRPISPRLISPRSHPRRPRRRPRRSKPSSTPAGPPEIPEMMDALDKLGNPPAVTLEQLRGKAPEQFLMWLDDRRNRRTIPHRLEACDYTPVRNPDAPSHGLWQIRNSGRAAIYAKSSLPYSEQVAAARRLMKGTRF
jgi:hypothetical protein